jgi:hypothetical protein
MSSVVKRKLSGSTDGLAIKVTATSSGSANTIHTAVSGTTNGTYDEVWLWAQNQHATDDIVLNLEMGGSSDPDNLISVTIPNKEGLFPVLPGLILQNSKIIKAFAATANYIMLYGFVHSITD